ncbi:hypothetical protein DB30_03380 [Enhygromyxa salina]|uniref:Lipoprotein n=1 Tax=Enhygromyxa salina TaxID=215803 RepID=A0A0C2A1S4_9BACT|nr:hypothetical protein [Enhygromyxa salina]KIG17323.1 hypothetical protein DB30_03380 [Enhygromyxa salina]
MNPVGSRSAQAQGLGLLAALLLCTTACTNEITATLKIDDKSFVPTSCRAGQLNGFAGVDLIDDAGQTLRLVQSPTNEPNAILLGDKAVEFGACGSFSVERQTSSVNDITNVMGEAKLECEAEGRKVSGTVTFKNCH